MLIGLSGKKRAGKDTTAAVLIKDHGYQRLAIADAIREVALDINPLVQSADGEHVARLSHVLAEHGGYEHIKDEPLWDDPVRQFLQAMGAVIAMRDPSFWPGPVFEKGAALVAEGQGVVITDIRFRHEVALLRSVGGIVGRVYRSDIPADFYTDTHLSEIDLDDLDAWGPDFILDTHPLDGSFPQRVADALHGLPQSLSAVPEIA